MDFKKLGNVLMLLGMAVVVSAVVWWFTFYSSVVREIGRITGGGAEASVFDAKRCLYSSGDICGAIATIATVAGRTPYEPMLFWFGLVGLVLGGLIRYAAKPSRAT